MTTEATERDLVTEVEDLLANAAHGPLTLIRYDHGGGRLYREEPRDLIADFYDAGNRELYYAAPELLRRLVEEVKRLALTEQEVKLLTDYHYYEAEKAVTRRGDKAQQQVHLERLATLRGTT